jgi:hypothetical protein
MQQRLGVSTGLGFAFQLESKPRKNNPFELTFLSEICVARLGQMKSLKNCMIVRTKSMFSQSMPRHH